MRRKVLLLQGIYYVATGAWPVIHIKSFMDVSGYKTDIWLVKMVGLLTVAIATTILLNYKKEKRITTQLGILSALAYVIIDVYYSLAGVISKIYLADAAIEMVIIALLLVSINAERQAKHQ
jgi:hypothetical protein